MHHATLYTHALRYSPLQLIHTHIYIHHIIAHNYYSLMESTHVSIYHAQRSSLMMMAVVVAVCQRNVGKSSQLSSVRVKRLTCQRYAPT